MSKFCQPEGKTAKSLPSISGNQVLSERQMRAILLLCPIKREPDLEFEPVTPIWTVPVLASFLSSLCVSSHEAADMTAVAPKEHKMCPKICYMYI